MLYFRMTPALCLFYFVFRSYTYCNLKFTGRCAPYKIASSGEHINIQALNVQNIDVCSSHMRGRFQVLHNEI